MTLSKGNRVFFLETESTVAGITLNSTNIAVKTSNSLIDYTISSVFHEPINFFLCAKGHIRKQ